MCNTMKISILFLLLFLSNGQAQSITLTLKQQTEDFHIFRNGLEEGHGGLYYFIDKATLDRQCDSIARTFTEGATVETYYLKLRYLVTLLRHGHSRINLPDERTQNYKLGILNPNRQYLPLQLIILNKKLYVLSDCSAEQIVPKGSQIVSINGVSAGKLMAAMLAYTPADGINQTFKYYTLYNYYNFHFLYNLLNPGVRDFSLQLATSAKPVQVAGRTPAEMEQQHKALTGKSLSHFDKQLAYRAEVAPGTAYLQVGSFYKGLIENFKQQYEPFIDSVFNDLNARKTQTLVLDLRNNEGGGDGYSEILFSHFSPNPILPNQMRVPGKTFQGQQYAINLSDDIKAYIADPAEFLKEDGTLEIKQKYLDMMGATIQPAKDRFTGRVLVLTNGGTFSAGTELVANLYKHRAKTGQSITFVGEEPGSDIYGNGLGAGQGYTIKLPNSAITVDMPFLCWGTLNKTYPAKRLPDVEVHEKIEDILAGKDAVLEIAVTQSHKH